MLTWLKQCLSGWFVEAKPDRRRIDALTCRFLRAKLTKARLTERALCRHFGIKQLRSLRMHQLDDAMKWITHHS